MCIIIIIIIIIFFFFFFPLKIAITPGSYGGFLSHSGTPQSSMFTGFSLRNHPSLIHFTRNFPYQPSISGYPRGKRLRRERCLPTRGGPPARAQTTRRGRVSPHRHMRGARAWWRGSAGCWSRSAWASQHHHSAPPRSGRRTLPTKVSSSWHLKWWFVMVIFHGGENCGENSAVRSTTKVREKKNYWWFDGIEWWFIGT